MRIETKGISALFKAVAAIAGLVGILLQCGIFNGKVDLTVLNYFTLMSNILCMVYFSGATVYVLRGGNTLLPTMKGAIILCISVTGLVYHFMLNGRFEMQGTLFWSNMLLHYVVPVMTVLDWILFDEKGNYTMKSPLKWQLFPLAYFIYVIIRVELGATLGPYGSCYPYFFMDVDVLGWGLVLLIALCMGVAFVLLGYVIVFIDGKLARRASLITKENQL